MRAHLTLPRALAVIAGLTVVAVLAFVVALATGSVSVHARDVFDAIAGQAGSEGAAVVRDLRMPRALAAFAVGALLSLAGALMQVLLRNPLADPYVLGISGGAGVGALMAMLLSDKLGAAVTDQAPRSPEIEALRQQIRESMAKPATAAPATAGPRCASRTMCNPWPQATATASSSSGTAACAPSVAIPMASLAMAPRRNGRARSRLRPESPKPAAVPCTPSS